jgi:hypothetical protein
MQPSVWHVGHHAPAQCATAEIQIIETVRQRKQRSAVPLEYVPAQALGNRPGAALPIVRVPKLQPGRIFAVDPEESPPDTRPDRRLAHVVTPVHNTFERGCQDSHAIPQLKQYGFLVTRCAPSGSVSLNNLTLQGLTSCVQGTRTLSQAATRSTTLPRITPCLTCCNASGAASRG